MSESHNLPSLFAEALLQLIREAVRAEIQSLNSTSNLQTLLTPEELAERLNVPISWVYEQSRQNKIPTHRVGRYIRFSLEEVLAHQKNSPRP